MYRLINFFQLVVVSLPFIKYYLSYQNQKKGAGVTKYWKRIVSSIPDLETLTPPLERRTHHYLFANTLTSQWFATLHRHNISEQEKMTGYYIAIATPIADYLVDHEKLKIKTILEMISGHSQHRWTALSRTLNQKAQENHPDLKTYEHLVHKTLEAQEKSLDQKNHDLPISALKKITWEKGGYALLLYRSAINVPISPQEEVAIFQLGGLMQLHNDIFDLYRDLHEGINTVPSRVPNVHALEEMYKREYYKTLELCTNIETNKYAKHRFFLLLSLAIQTGFICIDQYRALEVEHGSFNKKSLTREQLVCDMDDIKRITKVIWRTLNTRFTSS